MNDQNELMLSPMEKQAQELARLMDMPIYNLGQTAALYEPMESNDWALRIGGCAPMRGYWSGGQIVSPVIALCRGNDTWMSIVPVEMESQILGVEASHGHVAIMGLGMGWVAAETALRDGVTRVTIVERDPDVIAMHRELDLFAKLPGGVGDKVHIAQSDAFEWQPDEPVDLLMPDIWLDLVEGDRVVDVRRMQKNARAQLIYFWGQELEIARHAAAAGRRLDAAGVAETISDFDLPILIPDTPDYAGKIRNAARQWMNDRWFAPEHAAILDQTY